MAHLQSFLPISLIVIKWPISPIVIKWRNKIGVVSFSKKCPDSMKKRDEDLNQLKIGASLWIEFTQRN